MTKYSTRIHHLPDAPCEFTIYDVDPAREVKFPVAIVSAVGRLCTEPDTKFGNSILSQAALSPNDAIGWLKGFQARHSHVETQFSGPKLKKHAPELGALLGFPQDPEEPAVIQLELGETDVNAAVVEAFETGAHAPEFES